MSSLSSQLGWSISIDLDRRDDDPRLGRGQVDPGEGWQRPRIDDDALVNDMVEHVDHALAGCGMLEGQCKSYLSAAKVNV